LTPKYNEESQEFFSKADKFVSKRRDKYKRDF